MKYDRENVHCVKNCIFYSLDVQHCTCSIFVNYFYSCIYIIILVYLYPYLFGLFLKIFLVKMKQFNILTRILLFCHCELKEPLVCSTAQIVTIYICIYISRRTSFRKCSKCFYVYLNIRSMRYFLRNTNIKRATHKHNRLNEVVQYKTVCVELIFTRPILQHFLVYNCIFILRLVLTYGFIVTLHSTLKLPLSGQLGTGHCP